MSLDLTPLGNCNRLLFDVQLIPIMGSTFQPTGFPDLGSATFLDGQGTQCVLVESAQSMANRLEATIWDEGSDRLVADAAGLSYVRVNQGGKLLTSSLTESHRLNSHYILHAKDTDSQEAVLDRLKSEFGVMDKGPIDRKKLVEVLAKYDINTLLHGVFLAESKLAGGRLRVARSLSGLVEAHQVNVAASGGVKNDRIDPKGNVIFTREEFTAAEIKASFCLDLQQIRAYGLGENVERLLTVLALYKIRALLDGNLRFRTRCDLEVAEPENIQARRPGGFALPSLAELAAELKASISACADKMEVSEVTYSA